MPCWLISIVQCRKLPMYQIHRDLAFMQLQYWNCSLALQTQSLLAKSSWMSAQSSLLLQKFKWKDFICTWKSLLLFAKSSECYATHMCQFLQNPF